MLVSHNGAPVTQGDKVLIWGASGGLGSFAVQHVLNSGGTPMGVVSSAARARPCVNWAVSTSSTARRRTTNSGRTSTPRTRREWRRLGKDIRELVGEDPDIVFEHPGRSTMGASVFVTKRGGTIVTCAATSGYMVEYDNRHLWMKLKTIKGSHFSNYREAWAANQTIIDARWCRRCRPSSISSMWGGGLSSAAQSSRGQDRRPLPRPAGRTGHQRPRHARAPRRSTHNLSSSRQVVIVKSLLH